ncbi:phage baseplate assembly protein V [Algoriphagus sediminis]|uniref:Phage baseplate assembly protein V n=1 Tax=Algoriphagus sediminis TaxID=3057113 RepID=A0ABT7YBN0_9BACT|nr:phage baseplate assembly protein V [Algoriphagus sediminis]MDN3203918.1 phage baseplate assembly protein V [Algoriphagus sediminis]
MSKRRITSTPIRTPLATRSAPTFTISSNGQILSSQLRILSVRTFNFINEIPIAFVEFQNQNFKLSESEEFLFGAEWEIKAGYNSNEEVLFKGVVLSHKSFSDNKRNVLQVQLKDSTFRLDAGPSSHSFYDLNDKDIVDNILSKYSLQAHSIQGMEFVHENVTQLNQTDWSFILERAKRNACYVGVKEGKVTVNKINYRAEPSLEINSKKVNNHELTLDSEPQAEELKGKVWNIQDQEMTESTIRSRDKVQVQLAKFIGSEELNIINDPYLSQEELDYTLEAELSEKWLSRIRGFVEIQGNALLNSGDYVKLDGFGKYLSQTVFVNGVEHEIEDGKWNSTISIGLDIQEYQEPETSIGGIHIGVVTEVEGGEGHAVKVKIPSVGDDASGIWARLTSTGAGTNKGLLFRPDIGDEVLISFLGGSLQNPVVIGGLHSEAKPSPISDSEGLDIKGIFTKSGLKMTFDDEAGAIKLETTEGNKVSISQDEGVLLEDQSGNRLTMDSNGITISSQSDLNLSATGDITINGVNISANSDAEISLIGGASAELKSNAITRIQGSLVQIN